MTRRKLRPVLASLPLLLLAVAPAARAGKLFVSARGADAPGCGAAASPCRSISRAVAGAAAGDTIVVGPGRYGDLGSDGGFGEPGDEAAEVDTGCDCMIHLDKPLTLLSRDGAGATILDAAGAPVDVVRADAAVVFGRRGRGFTLAGSADGRGFESIVDDVALAGNLATGNGGDGLRATGLRAVASDNRAVANGGRGLQLSGNEVVARRNVVIANGGRGVGVDQGVVTRNFAAANGDAGVSAQTASTLSGNVAIGNAGPGLAVETDSFVSGNVAHGNLRGLEVTGTGNRVAGNAFVANLGAGVLSSGESGNTVSGNDLFGNGAGTDPLVASPNCGFASLGTGPTDLRRNFWGAPGGPGGDPADEVCLAPGQSGPSPTDPPAATEIRVRPGAAP